MAWPLLEKYALEDMKHFADSIEFERDQLKFYYQLGKKWKSELDELEKKHYEDEKEATRIKMVEQKSENLALLKELIFGTADNIEWYRGLMSRIENGDLDG